MSSKKFCENCGKELENGVCSNCGTNSNEKKKSVGKTIFNVIRYIVGGFFILGNLLNFPKFYSIVGIIFGLSFLPIIYDKVLTKLFKKPSSDKLYLILAIVLPIVLFFTWVMVLPSDYDDSSNSSGNSSSSNTQQTTEKPQKELSESDKLLVKIVALMDEKLAFDTGSYIKGDIPKGEYAFVKFDGSGSYYSEEDASGNILDNENFDSFGYVKVHEAGNLTTRGVLISVNAFEKLEVSGAKEIYEILNNQTNYNQGGYYKVGTDIEAGTYVVESIGNSAYYAVMTGPVSGGDIVNNDNFSGRKQVTLKNGQYITISRAEITKQ